MRMVLASASERRRKILAGLGYEFEVFVTHVDEVRLQNDPVAEVTENAVRKLRACVAERRDALVIAADTVVSFAGRNIGKPVDLVEAKEMLRSFAGCPQTVYTGVAIRGPDRDESIDVAESVVLFKTFTDAVIDEYFAQVDPLDKAGAYDIDQAGDLIIGGFEGSRTNIMGLPVEIIEPRLLEWRQ